jgi:putative tricarboxylic transport membrane protein
VRAYRLHPLDNDNGALAEEVPLVMVDRIILACTLIIAAVYFYATTLIPSLEIGDPLGPKAFPRLLGISLLLAAGMLFLEMWKDRKAAAPQPAAPDLWDLTHLRVLAVVVVWTGLFYVVLEKLGYVVSSAIYLLALMAWFNRGRWIANVLSAVLFSALSYVMFSQLEVNLPKGILPF